MAAKAKDEKLPSLGIDGKKIIKKLRKKHPNNVALDHAAQAVAAYATVQSVYKFARAWQKKISDKTTYSISVFGSDDLYDDVEAWIVANTSPTKQRTLVARVGRERVDDSSNPFAKEDSIDSIADGPAERSETVILSYKDERVQTVSVGGHKVKVQVQIPERKGDPEKWIRFTRNLERIVFTAHSIDGRDAVHDLLKGMLYEKKNKPKKSVVRITDRWNGWDRRDDLPRRPLDSVILRKGQIEAIRDDVAEFLASEPMYNKRWMPYHRGYLFHGPPGTGKTSVAWAIADHFGLDLWYMPLGDIKHDQDLMQIISQVKPRSVLLLEDVDVFHAATKRNDNKGVSLSGLLNALDGIITPHGLITIMTTNNIKVLDDALIRPGRIDRTEEIGLLDEDQAARILRLFYPDLEESQIASVVDYCVGCTPATILEVFKRNVDDAQRALKELEAVK